MGHYASEMPGYGDASEIAYSKKRRAEKVKKLDDEIKKYGIAEVLVRIKEGHY